MKKRNEFLLQLAKSYKKYVAKIMLKTLSLFRKNNIFQLRNFVEKVENREIDATELFG